MHLSTRNRRATVIASILALIASLLALVTVTPPAEAAVVRPFTPRFDADLAGATRLIGNTNMTCSKAVLNPNYSKCEGARTNGSPAMSNNDFDGIYVDVDGDSSTFNSSTANLAMPAGATVVRADLFWGGTVTVPRLAHLTHKAAPNAAAKNKMKFKIPGGSYQTITADTVDQFNDGDNGVTYSSVANVTSLVKANGTYAGADIQAVSNATNIAAGWSLVVVYSSNNEPVRSITVFSGFADVRSSGGVDIPLSGFRTPPDGVVKSQIGLISYEGDRGISGDTLTITSPKKGTSQLSDSSRPPTNFFNSFINQPPGTPITTKNPNYNNQLGFDIGKVDASGKLGNSETSATLRATTTGDAYYPTAFTFETELYAPKMVPKKSALDLNGGVLKPGDTIRYTVTTQNTGDDGGTNARLLDTLPSNVDYVGGSAKVNGAAATASVNAGVLEVQIPPGGTIGAAGKPNSGPWTITYDVTVKAGTPDGAKVINTPKIAVTANTGSVPLQFPGNPVELEVKNPIANLELTKASADKFVAGSNGVYTLTLKNNGPDVAQGPLTVTDVLPAGQTFVSGTGSGWTCTNSGQNVNCVTAASTTIANGATAPPITLTVKVPADTEDGSTQENTATGTSTTPGTPGEDDKTVTVDRHHDLVMKKTHSGAIVPGANGIWKLSVSNKGPSVAGVLPGEPIVVTDTLPSELTYVSGVGPDWTCDASGQDVTCTYGKVLGPGEVAPDILLVAKVAADAGNFANTASVSTDDGTEDNPGDNTSTDNVTVTPQVDGAVKLTADGTPTKGGEPVAVKGSTINNGPSTLAAGTEVTTTYELPADTTLESLGSTGSWNCTPTSGAGPLTVTCTQTLGSALAPGQKFDDVILNVSLDSDAPDLVKIDAEISVPGDIDPTNDTADIVLLGQIDADIQITTDDDLTLVAGGPGKPATFKVKNNGPSDDPGPIVVTIPIPNHLTATGPGGDWTCNTASGLVTCTNPNPLADQAEIELELEISAPDPATKPQSNLLPANVTSPANDSDLENNNTQLPVKILANADIGVTKAAAPGSINAGEEVTYTLTLKNWGPSVASLSTINDTVPAGFSITDVTAPTEATCSNTATAVECTVEDLDPDAEVEIEVKVKAGAGLSADTYKNTVTITGETDQGDDDHPNTDDADVTVQRLSNLEVKKELVANSGAHCTASGDDSVVAGTNVCYKITITNNGPSDAVGIDVTDTLPDSLSFLAAFGSGWTCDDPAVSCATGATVAAGSEANPITVVTLLDATATGTLSNTAKATPQSPGPEAEDEHETDITPQVDLQITHETEQPKITAGDDWTSTINVKNNGPSADPGPIKVEITLGPDQTFESAEGTDWTCEEDAGTVTCTYPDGIGQSESLPPITLITKPDVDATQALASSKVSGTVEDFNPSNDQDSTNTQVVGSADLSIVKNVSGSKKVLPGSIVTFTMKITNKGPSSAPAARVVDKLPKGLQFVTSTPPPCIRDEASVAIVCEPGTMKPGQSVTVTLKVKVTGTPGKITNTATVSSANNDPKPDDNTSKVTITVYKKPQTPIKKPPKKIKKKGTTVIYNKPPLTNAGKRAKLSVSCTPRKSRAAVATRGEVKFCQIIRTKGGGYKVRTFGKRVTVKVKLTSPGNTKFYPMNKVFTYRV